MNRGPKAQLPSEKLAKGTYRKARDGNSVEIVEPTSLPVQPDWLSTEGEMIWQDEIGRVGAQLLATEKDSTAFANYCNLQGAIVQAYRAKEMPPAAYLAECRKLQELFGIAGARSRIQKGGSTAPAGNPFSRNGRRPG